jgi:hypothetical protein
MVKYPKLATASVKEIPKARATGSLIRPIGFNKPDIRNDAKMQIRTVFIRFIR